MTRTQGFLVALIASNPGLLRAEQVGRLSGLGSRAVRAALLPLHIEGSQVSMLARGGRGPYDLAACSTDALFVDLDRLARVAGTTGAGLRRRLEIADERTAFQGRAPV